jgi:hypothetical protein
MPKKRLDDYNLLASQLQIHLEYFEAKSWKNPNDISIIALWDNDENIGSWPNQKIEPNYHSKLTKKLKLIQKIKTKITELNQIEPKHQIRLKKSIFDQYYIESSFENNSFEEITQRVSNIQHILILLSYIEKTLHLLYKK